MSYSNITIGTPIRTQKALIALQAMAAAVKKAFYYSPEDKFVETKQAADQLEALYELEANEALDKSEFDPVPPKFNFWV